MLRSLGLGLGLETCAKFLMISVSVSKNLVSEKKYRFLFRKIWYGKRSLGIGFGKFGIGKKVSVSVSENLVSEKKYRYRFRKIWYRKKKSRYRFRSNFWYRHSVLICTVYAYYVAKMSKIAITHFGGHVRLPKCNGGQVRWFRGRAKHGGIIVDRLKLFCQPVHLCHMNSWEDTLKHSKRSSREQIHLMVYSRGWRPVWRRNEGAKSNFGRFRRTWLSWMRNSVYRLIFLSVLEIW